MMYVRWKRYGFTHIVREGVAPYALDMRSVRANGISLCGNWWHDFVFTPDFMKRVPGLLAPSAKDDGKRPLCGTCKKAAEKIRREAAA